MIIINTLLFAISVIIWACSLAVCTYHYNIVRNVNPNVTRMLITFCPIINTIFAIYWEHSVIVKYLKNINIKHWFEW